MDCICGVWKAGTYTKFYQENLKRNWRYKEIGINMWTELIWLRVGASGVQLYTRQVQISYKEKNILSDRLAKSSMT
jgi:hypothetical protein